MKKSKPITDEQIDLLRSGLLDDQPALKERIEAALADPRTEACVWDALGRELDAHCARATRVNNQLRLRRRQVLSGTPHRSPRLGRRPIVAALASVALAITLAVFLIPDSDQDGNNATRVIDDGRDMPDLTDNVDFYVWMEAQPPAQR